LPGDHPRVAGLLAERADVRVFLRGFLAALDRLGVQLEDELVGGVPQLAERLTLRRYREGLVGLGGVLGRQDRSLVFDLSRSGDYPDWCGAVARGPWRRGCAGWSWVGRVGIIPSGWRRWL
jgi:hypothetical protein